ncbi:MAG TPA: folate-binding protein YgfZ [Phenylobacterium sp.]|nr:folate-binding protein YgfZ [Phenylobacterium sp.]
MVAPLTTVSLSDRALVAVAGPDWRSFLQGLITQDVETLAAGELRFGALLTAQGRLLHDLFLLGREDGCWLDVAAEQRAALIQRLSIYKLRAKVTIEPLDAPVAAAFGELATALEGWVRDPRLPELGWRGYAVEAEDDASSYDRHRLALGIPASADWADAATYPIEADFDLLHGIDFKKGCFVGQETTSRMKRRGTIKNRMLPIAFDGPPPAPGAEVLAGELRAGEVRSGQDGRAIALLRLDRIEGAALTVEGRPVRVETPEWLTAAA